MLILGKAIGLAWSTVKAILLMRIRARHRLTGRRLAKCRAVFERLEVATAQDILRFYRKSEAIGQQRRPRALSAAIALQRRLLLGRLRFAWASRACSASRR